MACTKCGEIGHNARTCPHSEILTQSVDKPGEYAVWQRYAGMTKEEAKAFRRESEDLLDKIAPGAFGVSAAGKVSELPQRIRQAIDASRGAQQKQVSAGDSDDSVGSTQKNSEISKN